MPVIFNSEKKFPSPSVRRFTSRAACLIIPALLALDASAANCTAPIVDGGLYNLTSVSTGKVLDITAGSKLGGAYVQQWGYGGSANQQFFVRARGNGYYTIQNKQSGLLLDVDLQSKADGARILQWPANGGLNQEWLLKKSLTGGYNIVARHSGKSITVKDATSGALVYQATDTATGYQRWFFNPVNGNCGGADGFAGQPGIDGLAGTTGGGDSAPLKVTSCSVLVAGLQSTTPAVLQIPAGTTIDCRTAPRSQSACAITCPTTQDPGKSIYRIPVGTQTCKELGSTTETRYSRIRNEISIKVKSNKTLLGLDGTSKLLGATLDMTAARNVIVRNLTLENINPGLVEGGDGISLNKSSHIWVDHVRFNLISDGHIDIIDSKNVTLSWNKFDGVNPAVCGNQHHYTALVQNSEVTLHHNFFNKTSGRNPKLDGAATRAHLYNNYWLDIPYFAINASGGAQAKVEGNFFANASRPHWDAGNGLFDAVLASNRYTGISATSVLQAPLTTLRLAGTTATVVFGDVKLYPYAIDAVDTMPATLNTGSGPR